MFKQKGEFLERKVIELEQQVEDAKMGCIHKSIDKDKVIDELQAENSHKAMMLTSLKQIIELTKPVGAASQQNEVET